MNTIAERDIIDTYDIKDILNLITDEYTDLEGEEKEAVDFAEGFKKDTGENIETTNIDVLINDNYINEYLRDLAKEFYYTNKLPDWIYIDWEMSVVNLRQDYNIATVNGVDYWYRW